MSATLLVVVVLMVLSPNGITSKLTTSKDENLIHPKHQIIRQGAVNDDEKDPSFWNENAKIMLENKLRTVNQNIAKNVIFFLGDGMSLPTIAATRAYLGGQEFDLPFDEFPHTALAKTYCVDYAVPDSACTATAYLGGVKSNEGTIGVNGYVSRGNCKGMTNETNHVESLAFYFQQNGKRTGLVTTTRVTDASPAGLYAHTSERNWQSDTLVLNDGEDPEVCIDIAAQLVYGEVGRNLNVILGGGRTYFLPLSEIDEEGNQGGRTDEINLIEYWLEDKSNETAQYVWNRTDLIGLDEDTDYLLGLFAGGHCDYNLDRDPNLDPNLAEMTEAAIKVLSKSDTGYFLFVEGGRIDHAHHDTKARKSLDEAAEFAKAIQLAINSTDSDDTLIIVTSDHSHTLSFSGYPQRGVDVLGLVGDNADDGLPYAVLNYANGPSFEQTIDVNGGGRKDLSKTDFSGKDTLYPAAVPFAQETHAGDDVVVFARGPWSHLFSGVIEQNVIPHLLSFASCVRYEDNACNYRSPAGKLDLNPLLIFVYSVLVFRMF